MKKFYCSIIFILISFLGYSQEYEYEPDIKPVKLKMGIYAGLNSATLYSDSIDIAGSRMGYHYGFFMLYGEPLFLRADFSFHSLSSEMTIPDTADVNIKYTDIIGMRFFHVPIQVGYNFYVSKNEKIKGWAAGGAYYEYLYKVTENEIIPELKRKDFFESSFGLLISTGVNFSLFSTKISYAYGLGPVFNKDYDSRKRMLSLSLGIKF